MQFGVNLLEQKKGSPAESQSRRRVKRLGVIVLLIYTFFMAILLVFSFYLNTTQKKVSSEKQQIEAKIKNLGKKESLALDLKSRMGTIGKILTAREQAQKKEVSNEQVLEWIESQAVSEVSFTKIDLNNGSANVEAEAKNFMALGEFLDKFQSLDKKISYLNLVSLGRSNNGVYNISLKMNFQ